MPKNTKARQRHKGHIALLDILFSLYYCVSSEYLKALPLLQGHKIYLDMVFLINKG